MSWWGSSRAAGTSRGCRIRPTGALYTSPLPPGHMWSSNYPTPGDALAMLAAALVLAKGLATAVRLPKGRARTLAFSLRTRNSFIVLPFALSLSAGWEVAAIVVVMQSLVELFGMVLYLWFVPRVLFPDNGVRPQTSVTQ